MITFKNQFVKTNYVIEPFKFSKIKGERRDLNPRMMEPQPTAVTTWPRPPIQITVYKYYTQ